jgi:hypothetical protein
METFAIPIPTARIEDFCRRWRVQQLDVFGSVLDDRATLRDVVRGF